MNNTATAVNQSRIRRGNSLLGLCLVGAALVFCQTSYAQQGDSPAAVDLEELVGPIALYPDELLAVALPASTYPLQIVQAARFLEDQAIDSSLEPDDQWDESIIALLNYPEVVRLMNDDLDWTWALGEAVLANQADVIDAVQAFRDRAYAAGNLRSDDRQVVTAKSGVIEIAPANPEVVYIPYYEPRRVVVYQPTPAYYYYPRAYPLYYYPYPIGYSFSSPFFWGVTSAFTIGWHTHFVHVHHHSDFGHPYYRNQYYSYTPYYRRSGAIVNVNVNRVSNVWQPNERRASRPLRNNGGAARVVMREDGSVRRSPNGATRVATTPSRVATTPSQRTIGGVATRNSPQQRTVPQGTAQRRVAGPNSGEIARELRNSAANRSTNAPQARPANPPQRAIQPRVATGTPQRAEGTGKALQQRTIGGTATRKLPQRTAAPPAATPRAEALNRSNAAPPREAARSGGTARPAPAQQRPVQREARQTTRR